MARKTAEANIIETWNKKGELKQGDKLEGRYVRSENFSTKFGEAISFIIVTEEGVELSLMGQANIRAKFKNIPVGSYVWIEYTGIVDTKNGAMKEYQIEFDEEA